MIEDADGTLLERAIAIAVSAHAGQRDKAGAPYILHPLRVMMRVNGRARIAAVLHDVVEDCPDWTFDHLRAEGFPADILVTLEHLTKTPDELHAQKSALSAEAERAAYLSFVLRAGRDPIARTVKLADLADNSDRSRFQSVTQKDEARFARYALAIRALQSGSPAD